MLKRTRAEEVLGEWGVRDVTPDASRLRDELTKELDGSPVKGRPLRRRLRNFTPDASGYVMSMGGPLPYMQRLRAIEDLTEWHLRRIDEAYASLAAEIADPAEFARRWRLRAERWSFYDVNDLIDRHNRFYPLESRLPMDPRTGDFVRVDGKSYLRRPLDAAWVLERFPAVRRAA